MQSLKKASALLSDKDVTHICFIIDNKTKQIKMVGDDISVGEFTTDAEVTRIVHEKLKKSEKTKQDSNANLKTEARFKLFAKPGKAEWKGSKKIRGALCEVLGSMGYGRNMPSPWPSPWDHPHGLSGHELAPKSMVHRYEPWLKSP